MTEATFDQQTAVPRNPQSAETHELQDNEPGDESESSETPLCLEGSLSSDFECEILQPTVLGKRGRKENGLVTLTHKFIELL
jgi:hypothetical protein